MTTEKDIEIVWWKVAIIERFSSVLYPLDSLELLRQLPTIGYVVPELALTVRTDSNKPIAQKGDIELVMNQDNKTIGVVGRSIEKTIGSFEELRKFYSERLDPSSGLATQYIEFDGDGWAKSGSSPIASFASFWSDFASFEALGGIVGSDVVDFGVHLAPVNRDPNSPEWLHVIIEPLIPSATSRYRLKYVLRSADTEQLLKKFASIEDTVRRMIKKIEG